jgi:Tfp pilus assembly protein PilN
MVVAKKDMEQYIDICDEMGIKIKGIRITFVEMLNNFIRTHKLRDKKTVFIYKDGGSYSAALLSDSKILSLRHFRNPEFLIKYLEGVVKEELIFYYCGSDNPPDEIMPCEMIKYDFLKLAETVVLRKKRIKVDFYRTAGALYTSKYILGVTSLAILSFLLYVFSVLIPYYLDYRELTDLQEKLKAIETEASDILNMNRELDEVDRRLAELVILKNKGSQVIEALSALSKTLPEHSWIIMFKYNGQTIDISGFSERAIDILKSLESSEEFKNVRFSSPIVTMQNKERFVIRMEIEQ